MSDDDFGDGDGDGVEIVNAWDAHKNTEFMKRSKQDYAQMSGPEKFNAKMERYLTTLVDIQLNLPDLEEYILKIPHIEYKNPAAVALSFYYESSREKHEEKLKTIEKIIKENPEENKLKIADILRYVHLARAQ